MASTPRASQRFSVQTNASASSASSNAYVSGALPDPTNDAGATASYSFGSASHPHVPPAFTSRRTSASTLGSTANSVQQSALISSSSASIRGSMPPIPARQVSSTSVIGSRFASFTSTTTTDESTYPSYSTAAGRGQGPDIVERPRDKTRQNEVNASALAFLFAEIVSYTQNRVTGVTDLEKRLSLIGYRIGQRVLALAMHRQEMTQNPKMPKRETKLLPTLLWIHTAFWKAAFGKPADSLERSTEPGRSDEYMISTNVPTFSRSICVPSDMSQLSVEAMTAGMVEAALDGLGFPARVTAHTVATPQYPTRTTILIKLDAAVMQREEALSAS